MYLRSPDDLTPLLTAPRTIDSDDVLRLRQEVFGDGLISVREADAVLLLNERAIEQCQEWRDFYCEALTDYVVEQAEPRGYVSVDNAEWLVRQIARGGRVGTETELEMLIRVIERANSVPDTLSAFVLAQVAVTVIAGHGPAASAHELKPGVIGEAEVELIRRILFAVSGDEGMAVSRREAEILFDLNDRTTEAENHPAWTDLFAKAVANHLMAISGYRVPDRVTALAREQWLDDTGIDPFGMLTRTVRSLGQLFSPENLKSTFKSDHTRMEEAWLDRNDHFESEAAQAERVDRNEAAWLVERIGRDGTLHANERVVLMFLREHSPQLDPALAPLMEIASSLEPDADSGGWSKPVDELLPEPVVELGHGDVDTEVGEAGDPMAADTAAGYPAGHDTPIVIEVGVDVDGDAMIGDPAANPDADRGDLVLPQ